jgi:hypothetical protein
MRLAIYIVSILLLTSGLIYGIVGSLDTAVTYKFEIEDPTVEIAIKGLPPIEQELAFERLEQKRVDLEWQEVFLNGVIVISLIGLVLLLIYRKRFLRNK